MHSLRTNGMQPLYEISYSVNTYCSTMFCTDKILNLDSLLIQLKVEVTSQWYQLGEALGVDKTILEKCSQYPPEESIVEILDNWLRNHQDQPTWREVAETLKTIGFQQLGCDIENVYKTGINNDCFPSYSVLTTQYCTDKTKYEGINIHPMISS